MSIKKLSRYELLEEIGRGNMGAVYRARDPSMNRTVAVKMVRLGFSLDEARRTSFLRRFELEAQIAGRLIHPHIVAVHDVGLGNEPFLVMEYFPGESLSRLLETGPFAAEETRLVLLQLSEALAYAHRQGVVHRDIKPGNVLYRPGPLIKLVDFGIARVESSELTATGEFMGTPSYMSPEIFAGGTVDGRSDLFSVGVLLYQLLTGVRPFEGENVSRTIYRVLHEDPAPPSTLRAGLEPGWDLVCARLLAKEPSRRYQDATALAADLQSLGRGTLTIPIEDEPTTPVRGPRGRRRGLSVLAALLGTMLVILFVNWRLPGAPPAPAPPPPARSISTRAAQDSAARLVRTAETALAEGRFDEVEVSLRALGAFEPESPKVEELASELSRARFLEKLPMSHVARHEHRIGHCTGDLSLGPTGIVFDTTRHGTWRFRAGDVRELTRPSPTELLLTARGKDGAVETYRFALLRPPLSLEDFQSYLDVLMR